MLHQQPPQLIQRQTRRPILARIQINPPQQLRAAPGFLAPQLLPRHPPRREAARAHVGEEGAGAREHGDGGRAVVGGAGPGVEAVGGVVEGDVDGGGGGVEGEEEGEEEAGGAGAGDEDGGYWGHCFFCSFFFFFGGGFWCLVVLFFFGVEGGVRVGGGDGEVCVGEERRWEGRFYLGFTGTMSGGKAGRGGDLVGAGA